MEMHEYDFVPGNRTKIVGKAAHCVYRIIPCGSMVMVLLETSRLTQRV